MNIVTAFSNKNTVNEVVGDLSKEFQNFDVRVLLFFSSSKYSPEELSRKMLDSFPGAQMFGCSTSGEIVTGRMLDNSVVAMAFNSHAISDAKIEVVSDPKNENSVRKAFGALGSYFKEPLSKMDPEKYVGMILVDGLSGAEECLMEAIGDQTNVTFVGGSAGDDLKFKATHVFANGKSYTNSAVLALLRPAVKFTIVKTQSFCDLGKTLEVTKVDEEKRTVFEFNGKPAAIAYAEAIGTTPEEAPSHFMHNPVGLMIDGEAYVRSPQQIKGGSMLFYCGVKEGMELSVLESTDIIGDTRTALRQAERELGAISGIINANCILRTLELKQKGLLQAYANLFANVPTVGFSSYGEQYIGHVNQTATMLVFK